MKNWFLSWTRLCSCSHSEALSVSKVSMRYRSPQVCLWAHGWLPGRIPPLRTYCSPHQPGPSPPSGPGPGPSSGPGPGPSSGPGPGPSSGSGPGPSSGPGPGPSSGPGPGPSSGPGPGPSSGPGPGPRGGAEAVKRQVLAAVKHAGELGRQWGQRSAQAASASVNYWWERYEEFVGLNEVRVAQTKVTEAEAAFMVARGMVREAHGSLEALQVRLKEVRDRLDRVSREEAHYLELATLEHKLLQEERRLRNAYENAEGSEREKFALFSAGVRESHEKERSRAERTKNWSIIGSVLGALIGVMGSTYVNRVRLQELKSLLLEAQKGPESLQEALRVQAGNHRSQQDELRTLIHGLQGALSDAYAQRDLVLQEKPGPASEPPTQLLSAFTDLRLSSQKTQEVLETLPPQLDRLQQGLGQVQGDLSTVRNLLETRPAPDPPQARAGPEPSPPPETPQDRLEAALALRRLEEAQRTLGDRIRTSTVYSAVFTYSATAVTVGAVYLLLRGAG